MTIMMPNGEPVIVPLARIKLKSEQGTYTELVSVIYHWIVYWDLRHMVELFNGTIFFDIWRKL